MRNLLKNRPDIKIERLYRTKELIDASVRDCIVTGYESLMSGLTLPDPDDRHVLAAAIAGRVDIIVTFNLKDFPYDTLRPFGIKTQHPDVFCRDLLDIAPGQVCEAIKTIRQRLKSPPKKIAEYLGSLERQELSTFVGKLRDYENLL